MFKRILLISFLAFVASSSVNAFIVFDVTAPQEENPDFTQGDTIPEGATHDWNLGPTGARGWMYSNKLETSEARQVLITSVEAGSPADGILQEGDVLLGVGGRPFRFDPRTEIGRAITAAETSSGRLVFSRWRDGRRGSATIELPVFGRYAPTAPTRKRSGEKRKTLRTPVSQKHPVPTAKGITPQA